jgi:hypothetical protein
MQSFTKKETSLDDPAIKGGVTATVPIDFARDIKPILDRSCVDCHSGSRPKGGFALISRDALLKGGQSGEPAIVAGNAQDSHLIHFVSGEVEDLEMPPLVRRNKYPALSSAEINRLRAWIDAGAPWPAKTASASEKVSALRPMENCDQPVAPDL